MNSQSHVRQQSAMATQGRMQKFVGCCLMLMMTGGRCEKMFAQGGGHTNATGTARAAANAVSVTPTTAAQTPGREADDKAVFDLLIAAHLPHTGKPIIVQQESVHGQRLHDLMRSPTPTLPQQNKTVRQALQDARNRGKQTISLLPLMAQHSLHFASEREMRMEPGTNYWQRFYRRFPNACGKAAFALPGYSADGNTAVAFMESHSDACCGAGIFLLLTREREHWKIKRFIGGWEN